MTYKNKKGGFAIESLVGMFVGLMIFLSFIILFNVTDGLKSKIETINPELSYDFPSIFVKSFLLQELNNEQKSKLGYDKSEIVRVKDLMIKGKSSSEVVLDIRKEYLQKYGSYNKGYKFFSNDDYKEDKLLDIRYDYEKIPDMDEVLKQKNIYYFFQNEDGKYSVIYFKELNFVQEISDYWSYKEGLL